MICFTPLSIFNLSGKGGLEIDTEGCSIIGILLECVVFFNFFSNILFLRKGNLFFRVIIIFLRIHFSFLNNNRLFLPFEYSTRP